jgi:hypothetical protein
LPYRSRYSRNLANSFAWNPDRASDRPSAG